MKGKRKFNKHCYFYFILIMAFMVAAFFASATKVRAEVMKVYSSTDNATKILNHNKDTLDPNWLLFSFDDSSWQNPYEVWNASWWVNSGIRPSGEWINPVGWQFLNKDNSDDPKVILYSSDNVQGTMVRNFIRKKFILPANAKITKAYLYAASDNLSKFWLNGIRVVSTSDYLNNVNGCQGNNDAEIEGGVHTINVTSQVISGNNILSANILNTSPCDATHPMGIQFLLYIEYNIPAPTSTPIPTVVPGPSLGEMTVTAVDDAVEVGKYGRSGSRAEENGGNAYNPVEITQEIIGGTMANVVLAGVGFASKTSLPTDNTLTELMRSSNYNNTENGFIVVYANKDIDVVNGPAKGACGKNFCNGLFYVYFKNKWNMPDSPVNHPGGYTPGSRIAYVNPTGGLNVKMSQTPAFPNGPSFIVTFYKAIGDHNWENYGYLLDSADVQSLVSKKPCDTKERTGKCETSALLSKVLAEKDTDFFSSIIFYFKKLLHF